MAAKGRIQSYASGAATLSLGTAASFVAPAAASAQEMEHAGGLASGQIAAGVVNGVAQGIVLFLVGLVAFAAVV